MNEYKSQGDLRQENENPSSNQHYNALLTFEAACCLVASVLGY